MASRFFIAEAISAINVAINSHFQSVFIRRSNFILNIIDILYLNGFIKGYSIKDQGVLIFLKYHNSKSAITNLQVISRPVNVYIEV